MSSCNKLAPTTLHSVTMTELDVISDVSNSANVDVVLVATFRSEIFKKLTKYQGVKEFHMLARVGCCNIIVFSPFKVKVTYYHPINLWLLGATSGNQGQTVMCLQCSETIKICLKLQIPYYHPLNLWLLGATNGNQGQTVMHL